MACELQWSEVHWFSSSRMACVQFPLAACPPFLQFPTPQLLQADHVGASSWLSLTASLHISPGLGPQVGPLQREHVLRLLSASAFTRQLAGLKLLNDLVRCAVLCFAVVCMLYKLLCTPSAGDACVLLCPPPVVAWLRALPALHCFLDVLMHLSCSLSHVLPLLSHVLPPPQQVNCAFRSSPQQPECIEVGAEGAGTVGLRFGGACGVQRRWEMKGAAQEAFAASMPVTHRATGLGGFDAEHAGQSAPHLASLPAAPALAAQCVQALTSWLRAHGVVHMVLKSNMHQAQYADQVGLVAQAIFMSWPRLIWPCSTECRAVLCHSAPTGGKTHQHGSVPAALQWGGYFTELS